MSMVALQAHVFRMVDQMHGVLHCGHKRNASMRSRSRFFLSFSSASSISDIIILRVTFMYVSGYISGSNISEYISKRFSLGISFQYLGRLFCLAGFISWAMMRKRCTLMSVSCCLLSRVISCKNGTSIFLLVLFEVIPSKLATRYFAAADFWPWAFSTLTCWDSATCPKQRPSAWIQQHFAMNHDSNKKQASHLQNLLRFEPACNSAWWSVAGGVFSYGQDVNWCIKPWIENTLNPGGNPCKTMLRLWWGSASQWTNPWCTPCYHQSLCSEGSILLYTPFEKLQHLKTSSHFPWVIWAPSGAFSFFSWSAAAFAFSFWCLASCGHLNSWDCTGMPPAPMTPSFGSLHVHAYKMML